MRRRVMSNQVERKSREREKTGRTYILGESRKKVLATLCVVSERQSLILFPDDRAAEMKRAHKQAVKEEKREKRKNKVPKHVKKRKEKVQKLRHAK